MKRNYYLVVLDGSEIGEIITNPKKIIEFIKKHEGNTKRTKQNDPTDGKGSGSIDKGDKGS